MKDKIDCLLDMICPESHFFYYFGGCWANGKEGTITDFYGDGIYRFFPSVKDANGNLLDDKKDFDDYITNPIVATGIVGYWLHFRNNKDRFASYLTWTKEKERKNILKIFTDYTTDKLKQYIEREQYSPSSWRRDLEKEFYMDFIIRNEEPLNEKTQALMEYITPLDQQQIKEVIAEYMLFLEEKRKEYQAEVFERIGRMVRCAEAHDGVLLHENEKGIYGEMAPECLELMKAFYGDHFKAIFDFANFVQAGQNTLEAYEMLKPYIEYIHIKDAVAETGNVVPAGMGDGHVAEILSGLRASGFNGFLSIEPHLGHFSGGGFSKGSFPVSAPAAPFAGAFPAESGR